MSTHDEFTIIPFNDGKSNGIVKVQTTDYPLKEQTKQSYGVHTAENGEISERKPPSEQPNFDYDAEYEEISRIEESEQKNPEESGNPDVKGKTDKSKSARKVYINKISRRKILIYSLKALPALAIIAICVFLIYTYNHTLHGRRYINGEFELLEEETPRGTAEYRTMMFNNLEYDVSSLPTRVETKGYNGDNTITLDFVDRLGKVYTCIGSFELMFGKLFVFPCMKDIDESEGIRIANFLCYSVDFEKGRLVLRDWPKNSYYPYVELANNSQVNNFIHIEGSSSAGQLFENIRSLQVNYDPQNNILYDCKVIFSDGSYAVDPHIASAWVEYSDITLEWSEVIREYNHIVQEYPENVRLRFSFVDTSPNGFILINYDKVYEYQECFDDTTLDETEDVTEKKLTD